MERLCFKLEFGHLLPVGEIHRQEERMEREREGDDDEEVKVGKKETEITRTLRAGWREEDRKKKG